MDDKKQTTEHLAEESIIADPRPLDGASPVSESYGVEAARLLLPLLIIGVGVGLFFALASLRKAPDTAKPEVEIPLVSTTVVQRQDDGLTIDVDGLVVPYREVALSAEVSGRVVKKSDLCKAGRFVTKGTMLVEIDPRDYQLAVRQLEEELEQAEASINELDEDATSTKELIEVAQASLKLQEKELGRLKQLAEKDYATASQLDHEQRNVLAAKNAFFKLRGQLRTTEARRIRMVSLKDTTAVRLEKAELDLTRTTVVATIDGVVVADSVEVDSYVTSGTPLALIEDISAVEVKCSLRMDELYWIWQQPSAADEESAIPTPRVDYQIPKTPATITYTLAGRKYIWNGMLSRFEGIGLDEATRTVPCRVVVASPREVRVAAADSDAGSGEISDEGPPALVRGMFVSVEIHAKPEASLLKVPEGAVRPGGRLWRVRKGKLDIVKVHVVNVCDRVATIRADGSGLVVGDKIVVTPLAFVKNGMVVKEQAKQ